MTDQITPEATDTIAPGDQPPVAPDTVFEGGVEFRGRATKIIGLVIKNLLLNILTLGFYRFWARTRVRKYIWNELHILGSPLEYTGTGKELFLGFLMIIFVIFLPYGILNAVLQSMGFLQDPAISLWFTLATYAFFFYLIGVATYRAQRYRLTRTRWRSIRAGLTGSSWRYGLWFFGLNLLKGFFGLITPYQNLKLWQMEKQNTHIGNRFFVFDKDNKGKEALISLYKAYIVPGLVGLCVLFIPLIYFYYVFGLDIIFRSLTDEERQALIDAELVAHSTLLSAWPFYVPVALIALVVASSWYKLRETRLLVSLTTYEDLSLSFNASLWSFFRLYLGNLLIFFLTLGLGTPFLQVRNARFVATHTDIEGQLDLATIAQSSDDDLTSGEGLADAFDMGTV